MICIRWNMHINHNYFFIMVGVHIIIDSFGAKKFCMFGEIVFLLGFLSMGFLLSWRRDGFVQYEAVEASSAFLVFYSVKRWITWRFENFFKILYQQWCIFIMEFVIPFTTNKQHLQWVTFLSFVHHTIILLLILCKIVLQRLYNIKRITYYIFKSVFPTTMSIRLD